MSIYRLQETNSQNIEVLEVPIGFRMAPMVDHRYRIFVGEPGVVSEVDDYPKSPYVTILQDIPDRRQDHGERLFLRADEHATHGTEFSVTSAEGYANLIGPHLFVEGFFYEPEIGKPVPYDSFWGRKSPYEPLYLPLGNDTVYLGGLVGQQTQDVLPQAQENTPFVIQLQPNDRLLRYWAADTQEWSEVPMTETFSGLFSFVKVFTCPSRMEIQEVAEVLSHGYFDSKPHSHKGMAISGEINPIDFFQNLLAIKLRWHVHY